MLKPSEITSWKELERCRGLHAAGLTASTRAEFIGADSKNISFRVNGNKKLSSKVLERGLVSGEVKQLFFFSKKNF